MPKKIVQVRQGRGAAWWTALSTDQKRALVYPRLEAGESNQAIADTFGVTPNSIASQRNKWNLADKKNPYELELLPEEPSPKRSEKPKATPPAQRASPKKPAALTQAPPQPARVQESAMREPTGMQGRTATAAREHKPLKVAASERAQCDHEDPDDGRRCAFEWSEKKRDGKFCANHAHLHS